MHVARYVSKAKNSSKKKTDFVYGIYFTLPFCVSWKYVQWNYKMSDIRVTTSLHKQDDIDRSCVLNTAFQGFGNSIFILHSFNSNTVSNTT